MAALTVTALNTLNIDRTAFQQILNRVYQMGIEDSSPNIAKFYRPERWTRDQTLKENSFTQALKELEISVVAALIDDAGNTLHPLHKGAGIRASFTQLIARGVSSSPF